MYSNKCISRSYISTLKINEISDDVILIKISKFNFTLLLLNFILLLILAFQLGDLNANISSLYIINNMDINKRKNAFIKLDAMLN